ncbi:hypothetical protein [Geobacter sp. DSM 9736]|uniref:hypothetical protein n=1 Tax=Geobacter sp. DSM 9736 TaxID=1277350 RepID=UPI000B5FC94A|nr:hypothetical protein [Geobacter sp. DSM 9736]SNB46508.1 hypothetical protein SAMN06269301_1975 [Geobacter sp. DSM 9736]
MSRNYSTHSTGVNGRRRADKKAEKRRFSKIAHHTVRKDQRVNIRISSKHLEGLKKRAIEEYSLPDPYFKHTA